jgi:hypothetical protein
MNERIKQLVKQAGLKSEIMLDDSSRDVECFVSEYDGSTPSIHYWEKFAKLIVRECADMAESFHSFHRHQYDMTGNLELHEFIREHFGVKE